MKIFRYNFTHASPHEKMLKWLVWYFNIVLWVSQVERNISISKKEKRVCCIPNAYGIHKCTLPSNLLLEYRLLHERYDDVFTVSLWLSMCGKSSFIHTSGSHYNIRLTSGWAWIDQTRSEMDTTDWFDHQQQCSQIYNSVPKWVMLSDKINWSLARWSRGVSVSRPRLPHSDTAPDKDSVVTRLNDWVPECRW